MPSLKERKVCKCGKRPKVKVKSGCIYQIYCYPCKKYTSNYSNPSQVVKEWNQHHYWRKPNKKTD